MFRRILIANRGEIACRVIRTARRLGIETVAVYSDADVAAQHVLSADQAVHIGPAPPNESYLVGSRIIEAAQRTGAQAIHPGYGFLSENAEFAELCEKNKLVFIGPPPGAIRAMGLKGAAKALMAKAGVPIVPGYHGDEQDLAHLRAEAQRIGFPVLIKAVAGGGGKGMRRVDRMEDFAVALESARREATSAFGDGKVLIERYLVKPRHIEIQVFADRLGNALYLFERDCSLQRRHQKVIEEAPAPGMPREMREKMGGAAVAAAKAIGYVGAGTVEFIADVSDGLKADSFYFMEMNTRLQVEHPVTEMITGQDLVEWQFRVACGEPLPLSQDELRINGHALEARIYAEDPNNGFLPSIGRLSRLQSPPTDGVHLRIDSGVREGDRVTPYYDPMIAKLIAWGEDRSSALRRLSAGLQQFEVAGVATNIGFLARAVTHPAFVAADIDTGFIERHRDQLLDDDKKKPSELVLAFAAVGLILERTIRASHLSAGSSDPYSPWNAVDGWRLYGSGHTDFRFGYRGDEFLTTLHFHRDGWQIEVGERRIAVQAKLRDDGRVSATFDGTAYKGSVVQDGGEVTVLMDAVATRLTLIDPLITSEMDETTGDNVSSPMPGRIIQVLVAPGADVKKGQALLVLEAMKMEHTIAAPRDGIIDRISFAVGDQVTEGALLAAYQSGEAAE